MRKEKVFKRTLRQDTDLRFYTEGDNEYLEFSASSDEPYRIGSKVYEILVHTDEAIDLTRLEQGALPFQKNHRNEVEATLGLVTAAKVEDGKLRLTARISEHADKEVIGKMREGLLPNISVHYEIIEEERTIRDGDVFYMVNRWHVLEVSSVAIPADYSVGIGRSKNDAIGRNSGKSTHEVNIEMSDENKGSDGEHEYTNEELNAILAYGTRFKQFDGERLAAETLSEKGSIDDLREKITQQHEKQLNGKAQEHETKNAGIINANARAIVNPTDIISLNDESVSVKLHDLIRSRSYLVAAGGIKNSPEVSALEQPFGEMVDRSPGVLDLVDLRDSIDGDSFYLPSITVGEFANEQSVNEDPSYSGTLTEKVVGVANMTLRAKYSGASLDDVRGLDAAVGSEFSKKALSAVEKKAVDAAISTTNVVNTGVATKLPAVADVFDKMVDMRTGLKAGFRKSAGFAYVVSPALYDLLCKAKVEGLVFNASFGILTLNGYAVYESDHLADGNAAGEIPAVVGDWSQVAVGIRKDMTIERTRREGAVSYFADMRVGRDLKDATGIVKLVVGA